MAMSGDDNQLVKRVKRMVSNDHPTLNKMEKSILAVSLLAVVTFSMAFSTVLHEPVQKTAQEILEDQSALDVKVEKPVIEKMVSGVESGVLLAERMMKAVEKGIFATEKTIAATERIASAIGQGQYQTDQSRYEADKAKYEDLEADIRDQQLKFDANQKIEADKSRMEYEKSRIQDEKNRIQDEKNRIKDENNRIQDERIRIQDEKRAAANKKAKAEAAKSTITKKFVSDNSTTTPYDDKTPDYILKDLIKDRYVKQNMKFSFEMNQHNFLLNNKKLPEEVRKRYTKKYLKSADWIISYKQEYESK